MVLKIILGITRYGAIWNNSREKYRVSFNETPFKLAINYIQDNNYFTLSQLMFFRQLIGIPMGSDPGFLWQIYLF